MIRIALTMRVTQAQGYYDPRDSIGQDWIIRLSQWGMLPLLVPNNLPDPADYLDQLQSDLLILTGGDDLGATPDRDSTETSLLKHALATGLPVLGVCRGYQLLNQYCGGSLIQHEGHVAVTHDITPTAPWESVLGGRRHVNSYHRFTVSAHNLGTDLTAAALDDDTMIEAAGLGSRVLGIMWHPERGDADPRDCHMLVTLASRKNQQ